MVIQKSVKTEILNAMFRFETLYVVVNLINQKGEEEESGIVIKKVHDDDVDIVVFSFFSSLVVY